MSKTVLVFGDSIVMGLWDERGGWPERLWDGRTRIVYNLGVDGETSDDVSARFHSEAKSRGANKNSVIIFAVGINDSSRMNGTNRVDLTMLVPFIRLESLIPTANMMTEFLLAPRLLASEWNLALTSSDVSPSTPRL